MIDLSVLICSTHTRYKTFGQSIQDQVWTQYNALASGFQDSIEIIMLTDNKKMMLGQKRNVMVDMAQGRYVVFVDDDDRIEPDYLVSLVDAAGSRADVITFLVSVSLNGAEPKLCRYSKDFRRDANTRAGYERLPNHICAVKRELAQQVSFPNVAYGEDSAYSKLLLPLLMSEHHIPRVLYHYDYNSATTETQQHRRAALRVRDKNPFVDVVILSCAYSAGSYDMTQQAINTCIAGANSLPVNVIVMEQNRDRIYAGATTLHPPGEFNYNRFANEGARHGRAPWIMVANNDLIFHDGWLHNLLTAEHPIVSPKCPHDARQRRFKVNTTGTMTGRHLSGWCFMLERLLWCKMGGLDEDVKFWCSDDTVIEQVKALGIEPMIVPDAVVEHKQSVTLNDCDPQEYDELTWGQLDVFIRKYGSHRLGGHPDYLRWKREHARRT